MSIKTIQCGYLPSTVSTRYHPIQNILLLASDNWSRAEIIYIDKKSDTSKTIYTIGNIPEQQFSIIMSDTNNYKIALLVNNRIIMEDEHLFYVDIKIHMINDDISFIKYIQNRIDDN